MLEIGQVIENPSGDGYKELAGVKLLFLAQEMIEKITLGPVSKDKERIVLGPVSKDDFERYYRVSFEGMGRKWISEDYKDFLEYILPGCEIIPYVKVSDLEDVRKATKEDIEVYNSSREWFIKKHELEIDEW